MFALLIELATGARSWCAYLFNQLLQSPLLFPCFSRLLFEWPFAWSGSISPISKIHAKPIPRVGGSYPYCGVSSSAGDVFWNNRISRLFQQDTPLILSLIGWWCDNHRWYSWWLVQCSTRYKLIGQTRRLWSCTSWAWRLRVSIFHLWVSFSSLHGWRWGSPFFGWPWLIMYQLIDGMDGLAGSVVTLAGLSLFVMSFMEENLLAALVLISFVGATVGFLVYNLNPLRCFWVIRAACFLDLFYLLRLSFVAKFYNFSMIASIMVLGCPFLIFWWRWYEDFCLENRFLERINIISIIFCCEKDLHKSNRYFFFLLLHWRWRVWLFCRSMRMIDWRRYPFWPSFRLAQWRCVSWDTAPLSPNPKKQNAGVTQQKTLSQMIHVEEWVVSMIQQDCGNYSVLKSCLGQKWSCTKTKRLLSLATKCTKNTFKIRLSIDTSSKKMRWVSLLQEKNLSAFSKAYNYDCTKIILVA